MSTKKSQRKLKKLQAKVPVVAKSYAEIQSALDEAKDKLGDGLYVKLSGLTKKIHNEEKEDDDETKIITKCKIVYQNVKKDIENSEEESGCLAYIIENEPEDLYLSTTMLHFKRGQEAIKNVGFYSLNCPCCLDGVPTDFMFQSLDTEIHEEGCCTIFRKKVLILKIEMVGYKNEP